MLPTMHTVARIKGTKHWGVYMMGVILVEGPFKTKAEALRALAEFV